MQSKMNSQPPKIMGILNVTPDSFSDGGKHDTVDLAVKRALIMVKQGADIIDIGGESTRPGAASVSTQKQIDRVVPVIERISTSSMALISIDTTDAEVAKAAIDAGASWINDVSAGEDSEAMFALAADKKTPIVLMHRKGKSVDMQDDPQYEDVCIEVKSYLLERAELAIKAGVKERNIILDPGIGFGKLLVHNLALLAELERLVSTPYNILLGTSRKRFIGEISHQNDPEKRVAGTCATTALGVQAGVAVFRVHDVMENKQAADIAWQIKRYTPPLF